MSDEPKDKTKSKGKRASRPGTLVDPVLDPFKTKSRTRTARSRKASEHARRETTISRRNDLAPELNLVWRPVAELATTGRTLRPYIEADVFETMNQLSAFGLVQPITIGRDGHTIVDGGLRVEAAKRLGIEQVQCIMLADFSVAEERALKIALNRLGQRRSWDLGELATELRELELEEVEIEVLGFDSIELEQILIEDEKGSSDADELPEVVAISRPGDVWTLAEHRLVCGDARSVEDMATLMKGERAQMLLTDPPYNIAVATIVSTEHEEFAFASGEMSDEEFTAFLAAFIACALPVLMGGATLYVFMDWRQIDHLIGVQRAAGLEYLNFVPWIKPSGGMGGFYRSQHELVTIFKTKGQHKNRMGMGRRGRSRANVWFAAGAGTGGTDSREMLGDHPTSKPVDLLVDAIMDVTDPGDVVLDPFGGSGSTLMAAEKTGRRARVIEFSHRYCDVIIRRWSRKTGGEAVLEATGETFAEVVARRSLESDDDAPLVPTRGK